MQLPFPRNNTPIRAQKGPRLFDLVVPALLKSSQFPASIKSK